MNKNNVVLITTVVVVIVTSIVVFLVLSNPDKMQLSGLNNKTNNQNETQANGGTSGYGNISLNDKLDRTFHEEFGDTLDTSSLKEMDVFTGNVIKQPEEKIIEVEEQYDEEGNIINEQYDEEGNLIEVETLPDNEFDDPLLKEPNEAILYKIQMYISGEIKNNGYLSLLTKSESEQEYISERKISYDIALNSARESASYIHYYDRIIRQTNADNKELLASWDKLYKEVVKYKDIIDTMTGVEDISTYREDLNKLKLVDRADSFIMEALKYIGDYNPFEERTEDINEESLNEETGLLETDLTIREGVTDGNQ